MGPEPPTRAYYSTYSSTDRETHGVTDAVAHSLAHAIADGCWTFSHATPTMFPTSEPTASVQRRPTYMPEVYVEEARFTDTGSEM